MIPISEQWARRVRILSTVLLLAGTLLVLSPLIWTAYTGFDVTERQTAALAAWEHLSTSSNSAQGDSTSPGLILMVPKLGVRRFVPEGATAEHLRQFGVGRISWSATPEQAGIVGIAGHRTTYGAPFLRLNRLQADDLIRIDYHGRRYTYSVVRQVVVKPQQVEVFDSLASPRGVALVACTPIYSAAYRLVVLARLLEVGPMPASPE
jgi:LPXTG-site transpeptidase (sortase) family protein